MLGFTIGMRTLRAAQTSLDLVGQNVANASTPGYSRRLAQFATTAPLLLHRFGVGTGVQITDLVRVHDGLLQTRLLAQRHAVGRLDAAGSLLQQLEGYFREPGDNAIGAQLDGLWNAFSSLTSVPDDGASRAGLVESATALSASFRQLAGQIASVGDASRQSSLSAVDSVNQLLAGIADVNEQILKARALASPPADLLDQRDQLLEMLADWVDPQTVARPDGTVDVLIDGMLVVSGGRAHSLSARIQSPGAAAPGGAGASATVDVLFDDGTTTIDVGSGALRGYLDLARLSVPERQAELDRIARELILQVNRLHTTGVSALGAYTQLTSEFRVQAGQEDAALSTLDLPFAIENGRLTVNVVDSATGAVAQHFVDVDPDRMSLADLAAALDALQNLSASVDPAGRLRVAAQSGFGFDFSARLDVDPDDAEAFGSDHASLTTAAGPFALSNGDTLTLSVNGGAPVVATFNATDFADITQATAEEVAAVLNAQLTAAGISAVAQDGRLVLQSDAAGAASSLQVTAATTNALFTAGASDVGSATAVAVALAGAPTAGHEGRYTVRALGDGVIGVTPGLAIAVLDESGATVGTFDVGSGYVPGDPIELVPGVSLSLTAGSIEASAGDVFEFDLVGDADTADALVGLQLGVLFTGSGSDDVELRQDLADDPRLLAGSRDGSPHDGANFQALLELKDVLNDALEGRSFTQSWGDLVAGVGFEVSANETAATSQRQLLESLQSRRDQISGVNIDEEMLKLVEYQQLYQAAGRYLQSVTQITDVLFQML